MKLTLEYEDQSLKRLYLACESFEEWRKAKTFVDKIGEANDPEPITVDVDF